MTRPPHETGPWLEQSRRDFKAQNPAMYAYIEARVAARELKRAGDDASGALDGHQAANRVWKLSGRWESKWRDMLKGNS